MTFVTIRIRNKGQPNRNELEALRVGMPAPHCHPAVGAPYDIPILGYLVLPPQPSDTCSYLMIVGEAQGKKIITLLHQGLNCRSGIT